MLSYVYVPIKDALIRRNLAIKINIFIKDKNNKLKINSKNINHDDLSSLFCREINFSFEYVKLIWSDYFKLDALKKLQFEVFLAKEILKAYASYLENLKNTSRVKRSDKVHLTEILNETHNYLSELEKVNKTVIKNNWKNGIDGILIKINNDALKIVDTIKGELRISRILKDEIKILKNEFKIDDILWVVKENDLTIEKIKVIGEDIDDVDEDMEDWLYFEEYLENKIKRIYKCINEDNNQYYEICDSLYRNKNYKFFECLKAAESYKNKKIEGNKMVDTFLKCTPFELKIKKITMNDFFNKEPIFTEQKIKPLESLKINSVLNENKEGNIFNVNGYIKYENENNERYEGNIQFINEKHEYLYLENRNEEICIFKSKEELKKHKEEIILSLIKKLSKQDMIIL